MYMHWFEIFAIVTVDKFIYAELFIVIQHMKTTFYVLVVL